MILNQIPTSLEDIEVSDPDKIKGCHFPDFMIIGPQRTGTGWLSQNLRRHPNILMSEPKEIYFFSHLKLHHKKQYTSNDLNWYISHFNESKEVFSRKNTEMLEYYGVPYSPLVRGEATASYATMDDSPIKSIQRLNPGIKIIIIVRNPIYRAWSHAKKTLAKDVRISVDSVDPEEVYRFFNNDYQLRCGRFSAIINRWLKWIKTENLLIKQFEDISEYPQDFLKTVCDFLEVGCTKKYLEHDLVIRKVNPTESKTLPPFFREYLKGLFSEEIDVLKNKFGIVFGE